MDGKELYFYISTGAMSSFVSWTFTFCKMYMDFDKGRDTFFSRAYIPFYSLDGGKKITNESELQTILNENRMNQERVKLENLQQKINLDFKTH